MQLVILINADYARAYGILLWEMVTFGMYTLGLTRQFTNMTAVSSFMHFGNFFSLVTPLHLS